jgi:hypothetical protein
MALISSSNTTTTSLTSQVANFSVSTQSVDEAGTKETIWNNPNWDKYYTYYITIPQLKQSVDGITRWTAGRGYETDIGTQIILEHIEGWGEDTFDAILQNLLAVKKINGDAYAEIIRDEDTATLINLKVLNPQRVDVVVNDKGLIKEYRYRQADGRYIKFPRNKVFHISESRIANNIHGQSVIEAVKWIIDAKQEAMSDWRRILHRSTIRVMEVDAEDTETFNKLKAQYAEAIKNGEVLILPKDNAEIKDYTAPPAEVFLNWIRYLDSIFYESVGVPKIIVGGSQEYTQADSKIGYLTFEQTYATEQKLLEQDLWNQLQIRLTFNRPISLKDKVVNDDAANTTQTGFQDNDTNSDVTRTE